MTIPLLPVFNGNLIFIAYDPMTGSRWLPLFYNDESTAKFECWQGVTVMVKRIYPVLYTEEYAYNGENALTFLSRFYNQDD